MPRNPDNTYTLVPDKDILPNTLQSSTDSTGSLVGIGPRFDDIQNTLSNTIPTSNSNNTTGNVNINANIDMNQNAVYNLSRVKSATSAVNTNDTTYAVSIINSDTITSEAYFYPLTGSSLYISQGQNPTNVNNLYLTVNNLFDGQIITLTSEIPIGNVYINNQATDYQVYDNTTVSFLITNVSENTFTFEIINTALINNYYSIPKASSSDTIYQQPFNVNLGQSKFLPTLTYASGTGLQITFTYPPTTSSITFTTSYEPFSSIITENMLLYFTDGTSNNYYYRIQQIVDNSLPNKITLGLDYSFNANLQITNQTIGYIVGFSFDFTPVNLLKFEVITNLYANYNYEVYNQKVALVRSNSDTDRTFNSKVVTNLNSMVNNTQIFAPFVSIFLGSITEQYGLNNFAHLAVNYLSTTIFGNDSDTIIGRIVTKQFSFNNNLQINNQVLGLTTGSVLITNDTIDVTPNRLEIYFTTDFTNYIFPTSPYTAKVLDSQADAGGLVNNKIILNSTTNAFINVIYTKKQ